MRYKFYPLLLMVIIILIGFRIINTTPPPPQPVTVEYPQVFMTDSEKNEYYILIMDNIVKEELEIKQMIKDMRDSTEID